MSKKKVLFVTNHLQYSNGVASVLVSLANALVANEFDVTVMPLFICDNEYVKQFSPNIKIKRVFNGYFKGLTKIISLFPQKLLYRVFIREKYDIEVAFQAGAPTMLLASSINKKAKHVAWIHGFDDKHLSYHEKYDKIICCAKSTSEQFKKIYKYPDKVGYLYNLVDDIDINKKAEEVLVLNKKYDFTFCAVGRLSPEKGFDKLIRCHIKLMKEGLQHNLWIIGDGAERKKLEDMLDLAQLKKEDILLGFDKNPYKYIKNCDMLVCSSYLEGMSTVCTEALILGKSVLTTEVNGAKELVFDNKCGIMIEDNSDEALCVAMRDIINNRSKCLSFERNIKNANNLYYKDRLDNIINFFNKDTSI